MDKCILENISSKYLIKKIFSYLKVPTTLKLIKVNKNLKKILEITNFHYAYYYLFNIFKNVQIEKIDDILNSSYIQIIPEDIKYEIILKLIEKLKLFFDEPIHIPIKSNISIIKELKKIKFNNCLIEMKEDYFSDLEINKEYNISDIFNDNINILFNYKFESLMNKKKIKTKNYQNIKYLNIKNNYDGEIINVSNYNNLEYLSIESSKELKLIFSKNQYQNLKVLKLDLNNKRITFEVDDDVTYEKLFENLKELHTNIVLLNKIKFKNTKLKKLYLLYDLRGKGISYQQEYFNNLIIPHFYLTHLNISFNFNFKSDDTFFKFIKESLYIAFNSIKNIENASFNIFNYVYSWASSEIKINKIPNKQLAFRITGNRVPIEIFESYFDKIEENNLSYYRYNRRKKYFYIEGNSSISSITKIRINWKKAQLYIPIKSYISLKVFELRISTLNSYESFPLFSNNSLIKFPNLEYLALDINNIIVILNNLIENFCNIPNLRFLSIRSNNICNSSFPYQKIIISKCILLKKLHSLIIDSDQNYILNSETLNLNNVEQYYSIYPELKNTNIKFCIIFKNN